MAFTKKPTRKTIKLINLDSSEIDYKNTDLLRNFVDSTGKILSFKQAGVKAKLARKIKSAIKRSRALGLMPYVGTLYVPKKDSPRREGRENYRDRDNSRSRDSRD